MTDRAIPEGFTLMTVDTTAAGVTYPVEVLQGDSLKAWLDAYAADGKNGEEIINKILNSDNAQGGKQGQKTPVREAIEQNKPQEEIDAAIAKHQAQARGFLQGAPRGGGGARHPSGLTKKQSSEFGYAIAMEAAAGKYPSKDRMAEIAAELGISPSDLNAG